MKFHVIGRLLGVGLVIVGLFLAPVWVVLVVGGFLVITVFDVIRKEEAKAEAIKERKEALSNQKKDLLVLMQEMKDKNEDLRQKVEDLRYKVKEKQTKK